MKATHTSPNVKIKKFIPFHIKRLLLFYGIIILETIYKQRNFLNGGGINGEF